MDTCTPLTPATLVGEMYELHCRAGEKNSEVVAAMNSIRQLSARHPELDDAPILGSWLRLTRAPKSHRELAGRLAIARDTAVTDDERLRSYADFAFAIVECAERQIHWRSYLDTGVPSYRIEECAYGVHSAGPDPKIRPKNESADGAAAERLIKKLIRGVREEDERRRNDPGNER